MPPLPKRPEQDATAQTFERRRKMASVTGSNTLVCLFGTKPKETGVSAGLAGTVFHPIDQFSDQRYMAHLGRRFTR